MGALTFFRASCRFLFIGLVIVVTCQMHAQDDTPTFIGELQVTVVGAGCDTVAIHVQAVSTVYGLKSSWFPVLTGVSSAYTDFGSFVGQHIDRTPNADTIGYAKYSIQVKNQIIYVDFRDGDFLTSDGTSNTYTNKDVQIRYDLTLASFLQKSEINGWIWVDDGQVVGEWEEGRKPSGESRIPVTVKNSWGGGYGGAVKVDGSWVSSPWQVLWNMGSHSIEAATNQGAAWTFDHWSDGGARSHSVSATLSLFSAVYTAYYVASGQSVITPEESVLVYPNPFNPSATIVFATTTASIVRLSIFNALGQEISVLVDEFKNPGRFEVTFDASALPTGMYYCTLRTQNGASTRRLLLLR